MTEFYSHLFGVSVDLTTLEMASRAFLIFLWTLLLVRIAGRRSFGLRAPFDHIVLMLLGAVLARAVVGASPMLPTAVAGLVIALLHRAIALLSLKSHTFGKFVKGERLILYQKDQIIPENMQRGLVSEHDLMEGVRLRALTNNLDTFQEISIERNGEISAIKKEK